MECRIVQHNLFTYHEGHLAPGLKKDIEAHLSECGSCKQLLTGIQAMEAAIENSKAAEPNPYITTRIMQHIDNELINPEIKHFFVLRPILLTLTALCAIAVGIVIGKSSFDRISVNDENQNQIENLKAELFIHDFIDENKTLLVTE
jgi:predicted anti-sigma-YlaC factor YlaD